MREIYTFYYKLANGLADQVQFKAVSPDGVLITLILCLNTNKYSNY